MTTLSDDSKAKPEEKQLEERLMSIAERNQNLDQALKKILDAVSNPKGKKSKK
ncbi:MAG: hypothetical protein H3C41_06300 [Bacteroidales bacterium]|nr:hypothetical protein [Bacteroidales bacterium]